MQHPPGGRARLSGLSQAQTFSPKLGGGPTGTKGRQTSHGGAGDRPFPPQPPGMRAPAGQAGPGRSSLLLAFVRDPAPAPHVGPEPGRGGGSLGRPAGRIPEGPNPAYGESR